MKNREPFDFVKKMYANNDLLNLTDPEKALSVHYQTKTEGVLVSGYTHRTGDEFSFEFESLSEFYGWFSVLKGKHKCLDSSLQIVNVVCSEESGDILSVQEKLTRCDEIAADYDRRGVKARITHLHTPWYVLRGNIKGKNIKDFQY